MKHLVIIAHHNAESFTHAIAGVVHDTLGEAGHEVVVRDLNAIGFNPVLSSADAAALRAGQTPEDIRAEQAHLTWAEAVTVIHPVWWTGLPAILKGYVDRVFTYGFAYSYGPNGREGLLAGRKVLIFSGHGHPDFVYRDMGMHDALRLTSDEGIWRFSGLEVVDHVFFGAVPSASAEDRAGYLAQVKQSVRRHFG